MSKTEVENKQVNKTEEVVIIRDEDTGQIFGIYDISNMDGELKDYYSGDFNNYDEYEDDMIARGAVNYQYTFYDV